MILYILLNKKNPNSFKIKMLSLMLLINIFTGTIGSIISNNFKNYKKLINLYLLYIYIYIYEKYLLLYVLFTYSNINY